MMIAWFIDEKQFIKSAKDVASDDVSELIEQHIRQEAAIGAVASADISEWFGDANGAKAFNNTVEERFRKQNEIHRMNGFGSGGSGKQKNPKSREPTIDEQPITDRPMPATNHYEKIEVVLPATTERWRRQFTKITTRVKLHNILNEKDIFQAFEKYVNMYANVIYYFFLYVIA